MLFDNSDFRKELLISILVYNHENRGIYDIQIALPPPYFSISRKVREATDQSKRANSQWVNSHVASQSQRFRTIRAFTLASLSLLATCDMLATRLSRQLKAARALRGVRRITTTPVCKSDALFVVRTGASDVRGVMLILPCISTATPPTTTPRYFLHMILLKYCLIIC